MVAAPAFALPTGFGTLGEGAGQISQEPQGIAVDQTSGDVYVADRNNWRVDKFGPEGEFILAWGWGVRNGSPELQTCTTATGCRAGIEGPGAGQFNEAEGIAVDNSGGSSDGDVYVIDKRNERVQKFGPEGEFLLAFGEAGAGPGQFQGLNGRSIAVDATGTVFVADENRVQRFSEAGVILGEVAIPGVGRIQNLALDSTGDLYLHGELQEGVHKYDAAGAELGTPRDQAGGSEALAIAVGPAPADELFLNDSRGGETGHHILTFDPAGEQVASFDRGGNEADGHRGIAYSTFTEALYVLNAGRVRIVTPPPPGPSVLPGTEAATEVGTISATLNAALNPEGPEPTSWFFEYGTEAGVYGQTSPIPPAALGGAPFEDQPVASAISNLLPRTEYHYRVVVENAAAEVTEGPDQTFTTLPPVSIDATFATQITATSATLGAELNPHGLPTTYHFEYDTLEYQEGEAPHGTPTPTGSAGSGEAPVFRSAPIQGLAPLTTYHYRVVATNSLGTSEGPDRAFTTQGPGSSILPDNRAYEMVTPPNKFGSPLEPITEEGGTIQAAADGSAFAEVALGPLGPEAHGVRSPSESQWFSSRAPGGGWSTADITTPHEEISQIRVGFPSEYLFFSNDLRSGIVEPEGITRLDPANPDNTERTPYRREPDGSFDPLVNAGNVPPGTHFGGEEQPGSGKWDHGVEFRTATPGLSHVILASPALLTEEFEPGFQPNGQSNLYELFHGSLTLLSILPGGQPTSEANLEASVGSNLFPPNMRGALSADGSRLVFSTADALYLRDVSLAQTVRLDVPEEGAAGGPGHPEFQAAGADGRRVFFTDASRLTAGSTAQLGKPDLYMCEVEVQGGQPTCDLTDLSVPVNAGEAANVGGGTQALVSAVDSIGAHVFFVADGILTNEANAHGEVATRGDCQAVSGATCNLYAYDAESRQIRLIASLPSSDSAAWRPLPHLTARSSPDGRFFTFMSTRPLTGYDNRDATSGQPDAEVFVYDTASGSVRCVSCNPNGARPHGFFDTPRVTFPGPLVDHPHSWEERWVAGSIPGWTQRSLLVATYQSRYLADSGREFFNAADALVPADTNGVNDVYEYEPPGVGNCTTSSPTYSSASGGCVSLISSGTSPEESAFLDASESGNDVFFLTASQLVRKDTDNALDVYDASVGGGEPEEASPPACDGDACQQPATPPVDATPGSLTFNGAGNVLQCPKGKVKKSGKCVKKKSKKHKHHNKKSNKRAAKSKRGGGK